MNNKTSDMTDRASRWEQVKRIFHEALEQTLQTRQQYLREVCAGDQSLLTEVERLLANDLLAGDFMEEPAALDASQALSWEHSRMTEGMQIGPYRLLRELGHGGMGTVYLAERADAQYQKQVAIKLIRPGMNIHQVVDRFRHERQILAGLDHPNIAKLLDGSVNEEGAPYFVMDFIEGVPIDQYCDRAQLPLSKKLDLFRAVCSAVHYAHQNLVVHRDLKPSNILVTPDGTPKLLDFGIAKILSPALSSDATDATTIQFLTPEYASPEQVRAQPITTTSDVYSLGVLLYKLLTGHSPYRLKDRSAQNLAEAICEEEPERPSVAITRPKDPSVEDNAGAIVTTEASIPKRASQSQKLRRRLTGDLDNIVLKALSKEPQRRYASVEQFSEDIRRHLEGAPVTARKATILYRTTKFIRRYKVGVGATALIFIVLLGGIIATQRQARIAERRFHDVRALSSSLLFELHDAIQNLPGATPARELIVKRALEYLDKLATEARGDRQLQQELATAYQKVGDVQGNPYQSSLGDTKGAMESYRKGLAIRHALILRESTNPAVRNELAADHRRLGDVLQATGNLQEALNNYRQALAICEQLSAEKPGDKPARQQLAGVLQDIGDIQGNPFYTNLGMTTEAMNSQSRALEIFESLMTAEPNDYLTRFNVSVALNKMAQLFWVSGDKVKPLEYYQRSLEIRQKLSVDFPYNVNVSRELAHSFNNIGDLQQWSGDFATALDNYRRALQTSESLAQADPQNVLLRRDLVIGYFKTGDVLRKKGVLTEALALYLKALPICKTLAEANAKDVLSRHDLILCYQRIGEVQVRSGEFAKALETHRMALTQAEALTVDTPKNVQARRTMLFCYENVGDLLIKNGSLSEASEMYQKELAIAEALAAADPKNAESQSDLALAYSKIGESHAAMAQKSQLAPPQKLMHWRDARSWFQQGLDTFQRMKDQDVFRTKDAGEPERIKNELLKCDAALAKFPKSAMGIGKQ